MKASKAIRLEQLGELGFGENLLSQLVLTRFEIEQRPKSSAEKVSRIFGNSNLAIRSSAADEDQDESKAGQYLTLLGVKQADFIESAVRVLDSYSSSEPDDIVLVQPFIDEALYSGVVFTKDPNTGSNYWIINWESGPDTTAVTSGASNGKTIVIHFSELQDVKDYAGLPLQELVQLILRICESTNESSQDIEWVVSASGIFILQVRPLSTVAKYLDDSNLKSELDFLKIRVAAIQRKHPYLAGDTSLFGVMPDWNPAELIGIRPNTLAFSLFSELISDSVWAYERSNLGYRNLRSFPLVLDFAGQPYVDVRVSLNSLLPKSLPDELAGKLVNFYLSKLKENPELHDKLEFEIVVSCFSFDWNMVSDELKSVLDSDEVDTLKNSLIELTKKAMSKSGYGLGNLLEKQSPLQERLEAIKNADLDSLSKIYWFVEDCKRYGTIPFAGIARLAFIATRMLQSLVSIGVVSQQELLAFTSSVDTPAGQLIQDLSHFEREAFLLKYGHLRPGTFDITVKSYAQNFESYFQNMPRKRDRLKDRDTLSLLRSFRAKVNDFQGFENLNTTPEEFLYFCTSAISGRENSKFQLSRHVSAILDEIETLGIRLGYDASDMSHVNLSTLKKAYHDPVQLPNKIALDIVLGRDRDKLSHATSLPTLIRSPQDVKFFEVSAVEANFVTQLSTSGSIVHLREPNQNIDGKFVLVESADPGYDWIFTRPIKGLVTCWGGANSHMAIRAKELNLPSAIGVGETLYKTLRDSASSIHLDCRNRRLEIIR